MPDYPLVMPNDLSEGAQALYAEAMRRSGRSVVIDPDSDEYRDLASLGYVEWEFDGTATLRRVDADLYAVATGTGPWTAMIYSMPEPGLPEAGEGTLLSVISGADIETRTGIGRSSEVVVSARIDGATDIEHSPAYGANFVLRLPTFPKLHRGTMTMSAVLANAGIYGHQSQVPDEGECDGQCRVGVEHRFAPYLPPAIAPSTPYVYMEAVIDDATT